MDSVKKEVMVNGLPGNMATEVAKLILSSEDFRLLLWALTGPGMGNEAIIGQQAVILISPEERKRLSREHISAQRNVLAVDFTHSKAANDNARFYADCEMSFVMGTTGFDPDEMKKTVEASRICAVIAPNMAMQIVAFQAAMKYMAETFPGTFAGYALAIEESHQKGKADTSRTAKEMVVHFNKLGIPFSEGEVRMLRDPRIQKLLLGVPQGALSGHGWHTYKLWSPDHWTSPDELVYFQFTHNVNGRSIYAKGTLEALKFLRKKVEAGENGKVYSMIDVIQGL